MRKLVVLMPIILLISACSSVMLKPADFAWPVESVLTTNADGAVTIDRYSTTFNTTNLFQTEFSKSSNGINKEVRLIRGADGYYYLTAPGFKHVYLLYAKEGALILEDKFLITENGLSAPVFNQRKPDIELRDGETVYLINNDGLKGEEK